MVKILTILLIAAAGFMAVSAPYIAAILYSGVSILQPQYIWFWVFDDISIFKISAGIAIVAWIIHMFRGGINWQIYKSGIFYGLVALYVLYQLSDLLSPFQSYIGLPSDLIMGIYFTILLMFFIVLGLIDHEKALKLLVWSVIIITLYFTYWANIAYFEADWSLFDRGRLRGPRGSPYKDGNIFSIVFVIGLPFVLFAIYELNKKWQQAMLILAIPFIWHAMILCASRGALLSAAVSTLFAATLIKSKSLNIALVFGGALFLVDQGGVMLTRTVTTVQAQEAQADKPINPRVVSWGVAYDLAKKYPLLGVGPQRFLTASRTHYPGKSPHVPHNTFLNFSANLGIIAGFIYLSFFWKSWKLYKWNKKTLEDNPDKFHTFINKASICSLLGFFVGSMFLDLIIFEPFYFLLLIIVANNFILKQKVEREVQQIEPEPKQKVRHNMTLSNVRNARV